MSIVSVLRKAKFSGIRLLSFEESKKKDKIKQGMKKLFILSFFLHGLISIIAQVIILRELMTTFYGNELFMATTLGFWLLGAGLGSFLAHKIVFKRISPRDLLAFNLIFLAFGIPTEIFLIRLFKGKFFLLGEIPNLFVGFLLAFFLLTPFCFILDAFFTLATRFFCNLKRNNAPRIVSSAYLWETLGLALGGIIFNFFLIRSCELKIAFLLSALSLYLSFKLAKTLPVKRMGLFLFLCALFPAFSPLSLTLNNQTLKLIHPDLVESLNSNYGRITITHSASQYNFFESGSLLGTEQDFEASEYLVHFVLNFHPHPKKVLLIGGGFNGVISEISKYKTIEKVDYVELDPLFLKTTQKYLPKKLQEALLEPKVKIHYLDGRKFLKETKEKYDYVLFLLPNPSTTLLNRFYTKEGFEEVKKRLDQEGIFVFSLSIPIDYLSSEAEKLASSLFWTAKGVFPEVSVFPETNSLFLASNEPLATDSTILKDRFEKHNLNTNFITSEYFYYRTKSDHIPRFEAIFQENRDVKRNSDFSPTAYFYQIAFWQTQFSFLLAKVFKNLANINWLFPFLSLGIFLGLLFKKFSTKKLAIIWVTLGGFILMTFEALIIFAFQATLGFVFAKISLVFTTILVFMALGNLLASKFIAYAAKILKMLPLGIIFYCFAFLNLISKIQTELVFYLLSGSIGFLVGTIFPLANQIYLEKDKKAALKTGVLYSADLGGAFLGAVLTSLFLIPILGVHQTVYLTMTLNILLFLFSSF